MGALLTFEDVAPLAQNLTRDVADIYITDLEAKARRVAPCVFDPLAPEDVIASARAILRAALLRWHRAGEGGVSATSETAGPFTLSTTFDTRSAGAGRLYDSEVAELRELCAGSGGGSRRRAYSVGPR